MREYGFGLWVPDMELAEYTDLGVGLYLECVDISLFFLFILVMLYLWGKNIWECCPVYPETKIKNL